MTPTRQAAVLGRPVGHSFSPVLHTAAYAALGLDWTYSAIDCGADELAAVLAERPDWAGFSCTMPLKRLVLDVADEVRPVARAVGAGNTLLPRPGGGWIVDNTDVAGLVTSLAERVIVPSSATVLGAGGTAQAAVAALAVVGVQDCVVLVRDRGRADEVRATADALGLPLHVRDLSPDSGDLAADLIVSTLPRGAADSLAGRAWSPRQAVFDVVYDPWPTRLAASVDAAGGQVLSGALLLLHQAAAQVELMTGQSAPVPAMRDALRAASPGCGV
ncbi:MAG: shikimate dehydrogenase [Jatrophihabitantaceae bacterium]